MICGFSDGAMTATIVGIRNPASVRAVVNRDGYDTLNPRAPSMPMMRQNLGGSPDATRADPDVLARAFDSSEQMRAMSGYRSHSFGRWTLVLAVAWLLSLYAIACGGERGEQAGPDGVDPETTAVARDAGRNDSGLTVGGVPAAPPIGCPLFPDDSYWHADVSRLPVHRDSDTFIDTIGRDAGLHADFGAGLYEGPWIGIPYTVVDGDQPAVDVPFLYGGESDPGPYPIPAYALLEGGPGFVEDNDRHVLVVERDSCTLYELWNAEPRGDGTWKAGSGAVFDLDSNELRPATFTSADAAGLPILPGLVRYEEVATGEIDHPIRFTVEETGDEYVWPARHEAGEPGDELPPMGLWLRLKADFDTSGFPQDLRVILRAMQKHGMILADNGSPMFVSGVPDDRWDNDTLALLGEITADDFEAVDVSSLIVDPDSGQVRQ